jgi:transcriptional regulator of acetoin/glycerol metabolism
MDAAMGLPPALPFAAAPAGTAPYGGAAAFAPLGGGAGAPLAPAAPPAVSARTLHEQEIAMIQAALDAAGGNISEASKRLGISRNTIYRKLRWNRPEGGSA